VRAQLAGDVWLGATNAINGDKVLPLERLFLTGGTLAALSASGTMSAGLQTLVARWRKTAQLRDADAHCLPSAMLAGNVCNALATRPNDNTRTCFRWLVQSAPPSSQWVTRPGRTSRHTPRGARGCTPTWWRRISRVSWPRSSSNHGRRHPAAGTTAQGPPAASSIDAEFCRVDGGAGRRAQLPAEVDSYATYRFEPSEFRDFRTPTVLIEACTAR
jgi:hypothetical protein